jgi:hypothetical protein
MTSDEQEEETSSPQRTQRYTEKIGFKEGGEIEGRNYKLESNRMGNGPGTCPR